MSLSLPGSLWDRIPIPQGSRPRGIPWEEMGEVGLMPHFPRDPLRMGMPELVVLVIFMLIFGVGKLPQVGKALGHT